MENENSISEFNPNIVYDILIIEADRFMSLREEEKDLYFKDPETGKFIKLADGYNPAIIDIHKKVMAKRKTRFFITFNETFHVEEKLRPLALKIMRGLARKMTYGNIIKDMSYNDISEMAGSKYEYIQQAMRQLFAHDLMRYKKVKNRRRYMINPSFYFKGSPYGIYSAVKQYKQFPKNEK